MSSSEDVLFSVKNALYLGAAQTAISDAAQLTGLTDEERVMRDILTHRAYIELGSSEVGRFGWRKEWLFVFTLCFESSCSFGLPSHRI